LKQYSQLKLDLASAIRSVRQLARRRNDGTRGLECQKLLARLAEDRFNLAVVGQFNRGKTSLMNALLGSDRLPTGVLPLTSVVTTVSYGDREQALIQFKGSSLRHEISLEDLPQFVTEKGNPGNTKQVALAEVHLTADLLRLGFFFTDTPGVGSLIAANTATTRDFLPEIDAAIFVASFESPFTEAELEFFKEVRSHVRTVFVVINKADVVAPGQRDEIITFVRRKLGQTFAAADIPLFAVSARDALQVKLERRGDLARSGLLEFERTLLHFLRTQRAHVLLTHITDRLEGLLKAQEAELEIAERASADPQMATIAERQFRAKVDRLHYEHDKALKTLSAKIGSELISHFDGEFAAWRQEVHVALLQRVRAFLNTSDWLTLLAGAPELTAEISAECRERARRWFANHQADFQEVARDIAADYVEHLDPSAAMLNSADLSLTISKDSPIAPEPNGNVIDGIPLVYPDLPPLPWRFLARWWIYALPFRFVRKVVLARCSKNLEESLSAYLDTIQALLRCTGSGWVDTLRLRLDESLNKAVARAETILRARAEPEDHLAVKNIRAKLRDLRNDVANLRMESELQEVDGAATPQYHAEEAPTSDALANCIICSQAEHELFHFMSRRQYELSTNESERLDHAKHGGFCALHTWHYHAITSPQGVCTAYPPVLMSLSWRLKSLSQEEASSSSKADAVSELLPRPTTCPACHPISAVEEHAAGEIAVSLASGESTARINLPALCLFHLCSVLRMKPDPNVAGVLILEQSRVLETLADNMQRYALKHDAIRRQLATEGEQQAHKRGVLRLVGSRDLSRPWKAE
jgi:GTP-binding protein EngB required for normal cell division